MTCEKREPEWMGGQQCGRPAVSRECDEHEKLGEALCGVHTDGPHCEAASVSARTDRYGAPEPEGAWWREHPAYADLQAAFGGCNNKPHLAFLTLVGLQRAGWVVMRAAAHNPTRQPSSDDVMGYKGSDDDITGIVLTDISDASTTCPLCGKSWPHKHSAEEIVVYRNGIKRGLSLAANEVHNRY